MIPIGWSVGDLLTTIKILLSIIKAFDQAKGAKKQYANSCGFLRQLVPVLRRLHDQVKNAKNEQLREDMIEHCIAINEAYRTFDHYLEKKYHGLSANEPSKARQILATVKWSLEELHEKVQKLKDGVIDAMQPYDTFMAQEMYSMITDITEDYRTAATSAEEDKHRFEAITAALTQLQERDQMLHDSAMDYQTGLADQEIAARSTDTAMICGRLDQIQETQQATKADIEVMNEEQRQLHKARDEVLMVMQKQQEQAFDEAQADRWQRAQDKAEKQAEKQAASQQEEQKRFRNDIGTAANALDGVGKMTGDKRLGGFAEKLGGFGQVIGATGWFGRRSKDEVDVNTQECAQSAQGGVTRTRQPGAQQETAADKQPSTTCSASAGLSPLVDDECTATTVTAAETTATDAEITTLAAFRALFLHATARQC